jgi:hypothetical protein
MCTFFISRRCQELRIYVPYVPCALKNFDDLMYLLSRRGRRAVVAAGDYVRARTPLRSVLRSHPSPLLAPVPGGCDCRRLRRKLSAIAQEVVGDCAGGCWRLRRMLSAIAQEAVGDCAGGCRRLRRMLLAIAQDVVGDCTGSCRRLRRRLSAAENNKGDSSNEESPLSE